LIPRSIGKNIRYTALQTSQSSEAFQKNNNNKTATWYTAIMKEGKVVGGHVH
jgi:hypothetical protein